jgi:hypothetical protein
MAVDEKDLVKAGLDAALAPVKDILNRLCGPFVDEVGGILGDKARVWRFKRTVSLLEKVKQFTTEKGIDPKAVPLKTLLPILENASLEDDEYLHDMWAALLATAADTRMSNSVQPCFVEILKQLTSREAKFIEFLFQSAIEQRSYPMVPATAREFVVGGPDQLLEQYVLSGLSRYSLDQLKSSVRQDTAEAARRLTDRSAFYVILDNIQRLGILTPQNRIAAYEFTALGCALVTACRRPGLRR